MSSRQKRHGRPLSSDNDGFFLDERPQLRTQRFLRDQIDGMSEQILQIELHAEILLRRGRAVESNENVHIAVLARRAARRRAEQGEPRHPIAAGKRRLALAQELNRSGSVHDETPGRRIAESLRRALDFRNSWTLNSAPVKPVDPMSRAPNSRLRLSDDFG